REPEFRRARTMEKTRLEGGDARARHASQLLDEFEKRQRERVDNPLRRRELALADCVVRVTIRLALAARHDREPLTEELVLLGHVAAAANNADRADDARLARHDLEHGAG